MCCVVKLRLLNKLMNCREFDVKKLAQNNLTVGAI